MNYEVVKNIETEDYIVYEKHPTGVKKAVASCSDEKQANFIASCYNNRTASKEPTK